MSAQSFPQLSALPVANLLAVFQKLNPASFIALRSTCSQMNDFAEKHRAHIGIKLYQINLIPQECYQIPEDYQAHYDSTGVDLFPIESIRLGYYGDAFGPAIDYELEVYTKEFDDFSSTKKIKLSEAFYQLSGFTFDKVIGGLHEEEGKQFSSLPSNVLQSLLKVLKSQKWRCSGMSMDKWLPREILTVIRPRILRLINREIATCPIEIETILIHTFGYEERGLLPFKNIPRSVKNVLIDEGINSHDSLYCLPQVFSEITSLFYSDQLPVSHVQVKSLGILENILMPIIKNLRNKEAGALFLREMLIGTPYSHEEIVSFNTIQKATAGCEEKWIATGNVLLTSKKGHKGLLAVRLENAYEDKDGSRLRSFSKKAQEFGGWNWMPEHYKYYLEDDSSEDRSEEEERIYEMRKKTIFVSVYFWKERTILVKATDPYYQIPNDGIWSNEMRSCK